MTMADEPDHGLLAGEARRDLVWYFGYGANMSRSQCLIRRRGVTPLQSTAGILRRHVLVFDFRAIPFLEPAYGNIRASHERDAEVHGVLHQLTHQQWQKLYDFECGGAVNQYCYRAVEKEVYTYDGTVMNAIVLVMPHTSPC